MPNVQYFHPQEDPRKTSPEKSGSRSEHDGGSEGERGRHAVAPWQIPWTGWKDILLRTYQQMNEDRLLSVAAGVVFYCLLALFPAISPRIFLCPIHERQHHQ
jgi:membrane protein